MKTCVMLTVSCHVDLHRDIYVSATSRVLNIFVKTALTYKYENQIQEHSTVTGCHKGMK